MNLKIENLAKINKADITIDGITIIAGDNNTGKSTVGKVLDAVFCSSHNMKAKMNKARENNLEKRLRDAIEREMVDENQVNIANFGPRLAYRFLAIDLISASEEERYNIELEFYNEYLANIYNKEQLQRIIAIFEDQVKEVLSIDEKRLSQNIYTNYFNSEFNNQINSVDTDKLARVELIIKDKKTEIVFDKNKCVSENREIEISNSSVYIDDPFIIDELNSTLVMNYERRMSNLPLYKSNLCRKLMMNNSEQIAEASLNQLLVDDRLEAVMNLLNKVVSGDVVKQQHYMYTNKYGSHPIELNSLSTGLKSFIILKQLLSNGGLSDRDVIVLDEPEIHLHPEWQLIYAEVIVMLQKEFDFSIVVTTHSSHFMEAVELYSKKHGIADRMHYYIASLQQQGAVFDEVTDNISEIYKQMVTPTLTLDKLREELESGDE
ncbi:AAA family ATPase [Agathobacter sp.]